MKQVIKLYLFCSILLVLILFGCNQSLYSKIKRNISELDQLCFAVVKADCKVSYITGFREGEYALNGTNTDLVLFGLLQVELTEWKDIKNIEAKLFINEKLTIKNLIYNPVDFSFVEDYKIVVKKTDLVFVSLFITRKNKVQTWESKLDCINRNWSLTANDALKLATQKLSFKLSQQFSGTKFLGEVYVQIISQKEWNKYFYLVCFYLQNGSREQIVIDPITANYYIDDT